MTTLPPLFSTFEQIAPCGVDMEYSPELLALQQAAVARAEQQFGSTIIPAELPDWSLVERAALALCERTCDVRVLVLLTQAWTELRGTSGFSDGTEMIADALEISWDEIFPLLCVDGEHDPMPRVNALSALGETQGIARALRDAYLLNDVHGQITVRNAEALIDGSLTDVGVYPGGRARLQEALKHAFLLDTDSVAAVPRALDALARIKLTVERGAGGEWAPDFSALERTLKLINEVFQESPSGAGSVSVVAERSDASLDTEEERSAQRCGGAIAASWRGASIDSRDDVLLALDKVCRYFDTHEPSHPAPLLIRRVQQTIPLDFHELLKNLAPQGVEQFVAWMPRGD